jgi:hypothetical protein
MGGSLTRRLGYNSAAAYAGPTFISATSMQVATLVSSILIPVPAGRITDDISIAHAMHFDTNTAVLPTMSASGWASIGSAVAIDLGTTVVTQQLFWQRYSGQSQVSVVASESCSTNGLMLCMHSVFRGCPTSGDPFEANASNSNTSTDMTGVGVTTAGPNRLVLNFVSAYQDTTATTPGSGWTEGYDTSTTTGNDGLAAMSYRAAASAGLVAAEVRSALGASRSWLAHSLALIPV